MSTQPASMLPGHVHPARHVFSAAGITLLTTLIVGSFFASAYFVRSILMSGSLAAVISATLVDLTNQDRMSDNLNALTLNPVLAEAAQLKANDMAAKGYFAHTSPEGIDPWHWFKSAGYEYVTAGENLAVNFSESEDVETAWMNSPEHRANILSGKYTEIGIATAVGEYKGRKATFVVQLFGSPRKAVAAETTQPVAPATVEEAPATATTTVLGAVAENSSTEMTETSEPTPVSPAVATAPRYATMFEALLMSPQNLLRILYLLCGAIVLVALILATRFEFERHHVRHIAAASFLLVLMTGLLIAADRMVFVDPIVTTAVSSASGS